MSVPSDQLFINRAASKRPRVKEGISAFSFPRSLAKFIPAFPLLALTLKLSAGFTASAQEYAIEAHFLGGGGTSSTNEEFSLTGTWGHAVQTSVSSGADYTNLSGFLQAAEPQPAGFLILACAFEAQPAPVFRLTISTQPGRQYAVLFSDVLSSGSSSWNYFLNTNLGFGTYLETNSIPSFFQFTDDHTTNTSGSTPTSCRFYRVEVQP